MEVEYYTKFIDLFLVSNISPDPLFFRPYGRTIHSSTPIHTLLPSSTFTLHRESGQHMVVVGDGYEGKRDLERCLQVVGEMDRMNNTEKYISASITN